MATPKKEKMAFSKKGWVINMVIVIFITIVAIVHSFVSGYIGGDSSVYMYLIPASWAELGIYSACLLRKSEKENTSGGIIYDLAMKDREDAMNRFNPEYDGLGSDNAEV